MSSQRTVALVPLRDPAVGKTRLAAGAPWLSRHDRVALVTAMLADVATALRDAAVDEVVVAAGGPRAAAAAAGIGLPSIVDEEPGSGLNAAVDVATERIAAGALLVVPADLPTLCAADVTALLQRTASVVVAPTGDGGTGGLLRRPPSVIRAAFGHGSAAAHLRLARDAGVGVEIVERPGFIRDVDTWCDLDAIEVAALGRSTRRALDRIGMRSPG